MRRPAWTTGVAIYLGYVALIFTAWVVIGVDYRKLVGADVVFKSVVLPLTLGALLLVPAVTWLGWWRPVMIEERRGGPAWTMWAILAVMAAMIVTGLASTDWSALAVGHVALIALAGVLVGFNEEALTRGILIVGFRGSIRSEVWVCIWSAALFGLLHLINAFFGLGLVGGLLQVVMAGCAGLGFYVLRRVSGGLLLPMAMHGLWDFASFTHQASGSEPAAISPVFQFGTYLVSIIAVILVLRHHAKPQAGTARLEGETP
ncbi:CPBP family intramembrane metalloprotease [Sedimentitalea sp. JM2-8]|uniref:CPBP family intramembrane metalloprotease n=1 Tax=Sedimentitalea xiamensis TaxID=3050037 RepID=A0ABT7FH38_9RHOB|nr:CPBP family intramembrane glutamic endopeptidase [Sedimentitalea xiamensis]MDK3074454.1 CPBP family intramembrane metalloprotease [Sedimentitalea xiamensis]